jgi:hypothetical protein
MRRPGSPSSADRRTLAQPTEPTVLQMLVAATLSLFIELGPARFSKLLDAILESEHFPIFPRAEGGRLRGWRRQPHLYSVKIRRRQVAHRAQQFRFSWRKLGAATRTP